MSVLVQFVNGALITFGPCAVAAKASPLYVHMAWPCGNAAFAGPILFKI